MHSSYNVMYMHCNTQYMYMYVLLCSCTYSIIIRKKLRKLRQMVNHVIRMGLGEKTASPNLIPRQIFRLYGMSSMIFVEIALQI